MVLARRKRRTAGEKCELGRSVLFNDSCHLLRLCSIGDVNDVQEWHLTGSLLTRENGTTRRKTELLEGKLGLTL